MNTRITRRDFMNGIAIAIAVAGAAGLDLSAARAGGEPGYPPSRDGLRGSHVGSFEAAHRLRDGSPFDLSQAALAESSWRVSIMRRSIAPSMPCEFASIRLRSTCAMWLTASKSRM